MKKKELTETQQKIFDILRKYIAKNSVPPTIKELCALSGLSSSSSIHHQLTVLEEKGYIVRDKTKSRCIKISPDKLPAKAKNSLKSEEPQAMASGSQQALNLGSQQALDLGSQQALDLDNQQALTLDSQQALDLDNQQAMPLDSQQAMDLDNQQAMPLDSQQAMDLDNQQAPKGEQMAISDTDIDGNTNTQVSEPEKNETDGVPEIIEQLPDIESIDEVPPPQPELQQDEGNAKYPFVAFNEDLSPDCLDVFSLPVRLLGTADAFFYEITDDSMEDFSIYNGDLAIVEYNSNPSDGEVVLAVVAGSVVLRIMNILDGCYGFTAGNKNIQPMLSENAVFIGVLKGIFRTVR